MRLKSLMIPILCLVGLSPFAAAIADNGDLGSLRVFGMRAPATLPGQTNGAIYLSIDNRGLEAKRLISARSPAAGAVSIHKMSIEGNTMRMREIDNVLLAPSTVTSLKADSGYHLMMTHLKKPLAVGDEISLTLGFETGDSLDLKVPITPNAAQAKHAPMGHMDEMRVVPKRSVSAADSAADSVPLPTGSSQ